MTNIEIADIPIKAKNLSFWIFLTNASGISKRPRHIPTVNQLFRYQASVKLILYSTIYLIIYLKIVS